MAQIQMTPELTQAFIQRIQREHGETVCSNFVLDILLTSAQGRIVQLEEALEFANKLNVELNEKNRSLEERNEKLIELRKITLDDIEKISLEYNKLKNIRSRREELKKISSEGQG